MRRGVRWLSARGCTGGLSATGFRASPRVGGFGAGRGTSAFRVRCFRTSMTFRSRCRCGTAVRRGTGVFRRTVFCAIPRLGRPFPYASLGNGSRMPVVGRVTGPGIVLRHGPMLFLSRSGVVMVRVERCLFFRRWTAIDAAWAVEAGVAYGDVANYGAIDVGVTDHRPVDVHHRGVIAENIPGPHAAEEADAAVAEAVVHAAVETNLGTPVAFIPAIRSVVESPVAGGPEHARLGWLDPHARNPVIAGALVVTPVSGGPEVTFHRTGGLLVNGQHRRRGVD